MDRVIARISAVLLFLASSFLSLHNVKAQSAGLLYSTFLGGSGFDGVNVGGITVDASGNIYITGRTDSFDFPTTDGAFDRTYGGASDAFVVKLDASGALLYSTYLGGSDFDTGVDIIVDAAGNAYVTGFTGSSNFPTSAGAFDATYNGSHDVFVAKLDPSGTSLLYSTYLGGEGLDQSFGIGIDAFNNVYVSGNTSSSSFPTTSGAYDSTYNGSSDTFVVKLDASGSSTGLASLLYGTYLGGSGGDEVGSPRGHGLAVDAAGNVYVAGRTNSLDFPVSAGAFDSMLDGGTDAFIVILDAEGDNLLYATYLGGSGIDEGNDITLDENGNIYVTGLAISSDFPTTVDAFDRSLNGSDAFVVKLDASGQTLLYGTYVGGASAEQAYAVSTDSSGNAYVTGFTFSSDFPVSIGSFDPTFNGTDVFVAKVNPTGTDLLYATYLGGTASDTPHDIAVDPLGNIWIMGMTDSADFPTTPDALDRSLAQFDAFVAKLEPVALENRPPVANAGNDRFIEEGRSVTLNGSGTDPDADSLSFSWTQIAGPSVTLSDAFVAAPTFTAPGVLANTVLTFQLVVNDGQLDSVPDTVDITVTDGLPIANAGPSQTVEEGALVTLDGSASTDADGDPLTFSWTQVGGREVTLSDPNAVAPTFTPIGVDGDNLLTFELIVNDGFNDSHPTYVDIIVIPIVQEGFLISSFTGAVVLDDSGTGAKVIVPPDVLQFDTAITISVTGAPEPGTTPLQFSEASFVVEFEPSQEFYPPGVTVTLPLLSAMTPETVLDLFRFDSGTSSFVDTGIDGVVNADGLTGTAEGILSFSKYAFFRENADADGDGILDAEDSCPGTSSGTRVNSQGCSGAQLITQACPGPASFKNHGQYVSCVTHAANNATAQGLISQQEKMTFVKNAAKTK